MVTSYSILRYLDSLPGVELYTKYTDDLGVFHTLYYIRTQNGPTGVRLDVSVANSYATRVTVYVTGYIIGYGADAWSNAGAMITALLKEAHMILQEATQEVSGWLSVVEG